MNSAYPQYEWHDIPWTKVERNIAKLQTRIYRASSRGDVKTVHRLQRLLYKSWSARCLAVRRVTQDNQGKKSAGIDGLKSLSPKARLILVVSLLKHRGKPAPVRRVHIPKPGTTEKRPLGIPTIFDRAHQALVKLAMEPEWEAKFEPNSNGFRPGRQPHDAVVQIHICISKQPKWVLDADIAKCFDRIDHEALLKKLGTTPTLRRLIKGWLKAGSIDWTEHAERKGYSPTDKGTPQGGVISPLLANIALHGMEEMIKQAFPKKFISKGGKYAGCINPAHLIRYADDFVILHEDLSVVKKSQEIIAEWLSNMGLELKAAKTRIAHTLNPVDGKVGFNFLGFEIRQYKVGKKHRNKSGREYKTIIKPSKELQKRHYNAMSEIVELHRGSSQVKLIHRLNPVIRGWSNYISPMVSKEVMNRMDSLMYNKLRAWAHRRHPEKSAHWRADRYWQTIGERNWVFSTKDKKVILYKHADTPVVRHVKVVGESSPYDGNVIYWASRMGRHPLIPKRVARLLRIQEGKCNHCGKLFKGDDLMEVHHRDGNHYNNRHNNLAVLHRHCHDKVHRTTTSVTKKAEDKTKASPKPKVGKRHG